MLGILSLPCEGVVAQSIGTVLVVGGAQSRAGSHRQNVTLARHLARAGFPVLRFDLPGLGDSPGEPQSFEGSAAHIRKAIDTLLTQAPGIDKVCLWGLCDGASASLLYMAASPDLRVGGMALLNPWVRSEASLARTQIKHYYRQRLLNPDFWRKLIRGGVRISALLDLGRNLVRARTSSSNSASYQDRMARAWHSFPGHILLMLSEHDLTAQEFTEYAQTHTNWTGWDQHHRLSQLRLDHADHTCSSPDATRAMEGGVCDWMKSLQHQGTRSPEPRQERSGQFRSI